jgi:hypothetical protein
MPGIRAISGALAVAACALGLAACGGDEEGGPIPQDSGEMLLGQLDQIETAVEAGACGTAQAAAVSFAEGVNDLPPEVGGELRTRLVEASANLEELSQTQCDEPPPTGATGETGEEPTTTTPPPTTTTETTTTDTTTDEPPPDEGDEGGNEGGEEESTPPPGGGNAGGGSGSGDGSDGDGSSGGIGSDE